MPALQWARQAAHQWIVAASELDTVAKEAQRGCHHRKRKITTN
jgi:hypothetical protein